MDPSYTRLMNTNETTSTMTATLTAPATTVPMPERFTTLSADIQADITEMVNEAGYPLDDICDFIEMYGADAYTSGHYVTWCQLTEELGASNDAIEAFVGEFGIEAIGDFEDAFYGEYDSEADFAEQHFDAMYSGLGELEGAGLVVDWQATWDTNLRYDFTYAGGFVFRSAF